MKCTAISNNNAIVLIWSFGKKLDGCVGFDIRRIKAESFDKNDMSPQGVSLKAEVKFPSNRLNSSSDKTSENPVQKFIWTDLEAYDNDLDLQKKYVYQIIPMEIDHEQQNGTQKAIPLKPLNSIKPLFSNEISLDCQHGSKENPGSFELFFNRGILATQEIADLLIKLEKGSGIDEMKEMIFDPNHPIRQKMARDFLRVIPEFLDEAVNQDGYLYSAFYELKDPFFISKIKSYKEKMNLILSNVVDDNAPDKDGNHELRKELQANGVNITNRLLSGDHIGHNKFVVACDKNKQPYAVLTGSLNLTPSGLCGQTNNIIIIREKEIAAKYLEYWNRLKQDTEEAKDSNDLQNQNFRLSNASLITECNLPGSKETTICFSPNTKQEGKKEGVTPPDMDMVYKIIKSAKKAVFFLAFIPGRPSIVDAAAEALSLNKNLFVRGAITDEETAQNFNVNLSKSDSQALLKTGNQKYVESIIPAKGLKKSFGEWNKELTKVGFAAIHDKIVVTDPFDDENCTVVLGSHNLGNKASFSNDENLLIIKGNPSLSKAYMAHIIHIYDHYRWRYLFNEFGCDAYFRLAEDDSWQDKYFDSDGNIFNPELKFGF